MYMAWLRNCLLRVSIIFQNYMRGVSVIIDQICPVLDISRKRPGLIVVSQRLIALHLAREACGLPGPLMR